MTLNTSQLAWERWEDLTNMHPEREAIVHWDALSEPFRWTRRNLFDMALKIASFLIDEGINTGDVCALMMRHSKHFYPIYMGVVLSGAIPAVLAYPNPRLHLEKFIHGLLGISQYSGLNWVLTERDLGSKVSLLINNKASSVKKIFFPYEWVDSEQNKNPNHKMIKEKLKTIDCSMPLLLQHSSGTTGLQKAVVLSHRAVLEHVRCYSEAIMLTEKDKVVSWLPLYHDMGLIAAFLVPLFFGISTVQIDPFQWVTAPSILLQAISEEKGTLTWMPNFAYNFMANKINEKDLKVADLTSIRMFINCSEVVRAESHKIFLDRFEKFGIRKKSLSACYAMAETTFAVTQVEPNTEISTIALDGDSLTKRIVNPTNVTSSTRVLASSGRPISGCALKIVNDAGEELSEDKIGIIAIKSVSLFSGYRNNPEKTAKIIKDGWYLSGDLGFCHAGEYYILGREDDIIIVAGNNIFPEDIENAINKVEGVIPGRVVAFGIDDSETGTEKVCVIAETSCETDQEKGSLKLAILQAGMSIDVTIATIQLVPHRWLIKSSSGKISRKTNKERFIKSMNIIKGNN